MKNFLRFLIFSLIFGSISTVKAPPGLFARAKNWVNAKLGRGAAPVRPLDVDAHHAVAQPVPVDVHAQYPMPIQNPMLRQAPAPAPVRRVSVSVRRVASAAPGSPRASGVRQAPAIRRSSSEESLEASGAGESKASPRAAVRRFSSDESVAAAGVVDSGLGEAKESPRASSRRLSTSSDDSFNSSDMHAALAEAASLRRELTAQVARDRLAVFADVKAAHAKQREIESALYRPLGEQRLRPTAGSPEGGARRVQRPSAARIEQLKQADAKMPTVVASAMAPARAGLKSRAADLERQIAATQEDALNFAKAKNKPRAGFAIQHRNILQRQLEKVRGQLRNVDYIAGGVAPDSY